MNTTDQLLWGKLNPDQNEIQKFTLGQVTIFIQWKEYEIGIAHIYPGPKTKNLSQKNIPENLEWQRWPLISKSSKLQISPALPDRPLLVKPETSLNLIGNSEIKIFFRFPVSIKISILSNSRTEELIQIPSIKLSNTWFGNFREGQICYSVISGVRSEIETDNNRLYMAICPLLLRNKSIDSFKVDKICLRSDHISLFLHQNQIWTDDISISYSGKNETNQVHFSGKQPSDLSGAKQIAKPRDVVKKSLYASSFSTIRDLYGSGLFASK